MSAQVVSLADHSVAHYQAHVAGESMATTADAIQQLDLTEREFLRYPWPTLDAVVGGIGPNRITFAAAPPEGGKTAFMLSLLDGWASQGVRIAGAFLETPPDTMAVQWACFRAGINYEDIGTGAYLQWPNCNEIKGLLSRTLGDMAMEFSRHVMLSDTPSLTAASVVNLFEDALRWNADVLIIDHIDHIDGGSDGSRGFLEHNAILTTCQRMMREARDRGSHLRLFATSQMNNDAVRRGGILGRAMPPLASDLYMGSKKEQIADYLLGLHRIKRPAQDGDKALETDIKEGRRQVNDILMQNVIGVRLMKRRVGGRSGITVPLGFRRGRVVEPTSTPTAMRTPDDAYDISLSP